jgi:acyl-coenzyme A thioesterase PaaI-like protein
VAAVNLQINYHKPVPLNERFFVEAKMNQIEERKIFSYGEIKNADSTIFVSGSGIYVVAPQLFEKIDIDNSKKNEKNH